MLQEKSTLYERSDSVTQKATLAKQ